jgi:asparagine synthase (glutamine-hydrolysing)
LSIIDLSEAGHQPMPNEDGTIWLVFNGEIYNYLELIPLLQQKGHVFRSRTDTEVIIHAYEEWGERCVQRFNGMWAFALWDGREQKLLLSRDRFGVKPLYYFETQKAVYFASEIKSILAATSEARCLNYPYLYHFLPSGALDDGEETFFEGVKQLLPSHSLIFQHNGQRLDQYWRYDPETAKTSYDYAHPEETLRALLADSVRLRLRSDVPVGTCLSGGLDSSSIVCLASQMLAHPIKTFSCLYDDSDCNERQFVDAVNLHARTDAYPVCPNGRDLFDVLPKIVWHQDEPTAGPGLYSQWHVMAAAQGKVKVLLDGQGGDELLAGYFTYFDTYLSCLIQDLIRTKRPIYLASFLSAIREIRSVSNQPILSQQIQRYLPGKLASLVRRATSLVKRVDPAGFVIAPPVIHDDLKGQALGREIVRNQPRQLDNELNNLLYWHLVRQSIPALLHYEDRNSMAFSIEARTPFLDYRLVEFCLGLPYDVKMKNGVTKHILRQAMSRDLPPAVRDRKDKKGYPTPMARWFRESSQRHLKDILYDKRTADRKIFNMEGIRFYVERHCEGKTDASWQIYRWVTTELWFRTFIDA